MKIFAVPYTLEPTFNPATPRVVIEGDYSGVAEWTMGASPDGQRFLVLKGPEDAGPYTRLNVVTNWFEELKQKAPVDK